jgi:hypothetical protein
MYCFRACFSEKWLNRRNCPTIPNTVFFLYTELPNELFLESEYDVNFTSKFVILFGCLTECDINVLNGYENETDTNTEHLNLIITLLFWVFFNENEHINMFYFVSLF